jgi:hypothetical protein
VFVVKNDEPHDVMAGEKVGMRTVILAEPRQFSRGVHTYTWERETANIFCIPRGKALDAALVVWNLMPWGGRERCETNGVIRDYEEWEKVAPPLPPGRFTSECPERQAHWEAYRAAWAAEHNCRPLVAGCA